MYTRGGNAKHKYKEKVLAAAYLVFLLVEAGEFFVSIREKSSPEPHQSEVEEHLSMPEHLPESGNHERITFRKTFADNREKS